MSQAATIESWYQEHKKDADFFLVYIREAHPSDGRRPIRGAPKDPKNLTERDGLAKTTCKRLKLSMPCVVDDMKDTANKAYGAWPDRLYVINTDGKVAYKAKPGPWGFKPKAARQVLVKILAEAPPKAEGKPKKRFF